MSAAKKPEELRAHARYFVKSQTLARVVLPNNQVCAIRDISYSGFSIDINLDRLSADQVRIELLDQGVTATAALVHNGPWGTGFCFHHKSLETLVFLQPFVERLRVGSTMKKIPKEIVNEKYRGDEWIALRGDGPTDLMIKLGAARNVEALLLTFRHNDNYYELRIRDGQLYTGKQIDLEGVSGRMSETVGIDRPVARQGLFILAGIADEGTRQLIAPLIDTHAKEFVAKKS